METKGGEVLDEVRTENLKSNRSYVLKTLRRYREGRLPAESAAINLLEIRHRLLIPWMTKECWQEGHPYATLTGRIVCIAKILMGKEWAENFIESQYTK